MVLQIENFNPRHVDITTLCMHRLEFENLRKPI
jgi:hypothetical protein